MSKKEKSEKELLEEISLKLDKLIGVLAISGKDPKKQIQMLTGLGFSITETSIMTGQTIDVVKKERSKLKNS